MTSFGNAKIDQGCSCTRLLCFMALALLIGKSLCRSSSRAMTMNFKKLSPRVILCRLWREEDKIVPKPRSQFTHEEAKKVTKIIDP